MIESLNNGDYIPEDHVIYKLLHNYYMYRDWRYLAEKYKKYVDLIHADRSYVTRDEFRQHTGVSITHLDEWHYRVYDKNKLSEWLKECGSGIMTYPYLGVDWREEEWTIYL